MAPGDTTPPLKEQANGKTPVQDHWVVSKFETGIGCEHKRSFVKRCQSNTVILTVPHFPGNVSLGLRVAPERVTQSRTLFGRQDAQRRVLGLLLGQLLFDFVLNITN